MTKHITLPVARKLVDAAIAEHGKDYIPADRCVYFSGETPACIVGVALAQEGLTEAALYTLPGVDEDGELYSLGNPNVCNFGALSPHLKHAGLTFTPAAVTFLNEAQSAQDKRKTWGEARKEGNRALSPR